MFLIIKLIFILILLGAVFLSSFFFFGGEIAETVDKAKGAVPAVTETIDKARSSLPALGEIFDKLKLPDIFKSDKGEKPSADDERAKNERDDKGANEKTRTSRQGEWDNLPGDGDKDKDPNLTEEAVMYRVNRLIFLSEAVKERMQSKSFTKLSDISPEMKNAIISVEDARFYEHNGLDFSAIMRAALVNIQYGEITQGASTITQQLAKNLFLSQERTFDRKLEEIALSLRIEAQYSKDEILELYLNSIYFGSGYYGITDAAKGYFGKTPDELTLPEAAMLAGLPNAPSIYSPYEDFSLAKKRQFIVLDSMVTNNYIPVDIAEEAKRTPLEFAR